MSKFFRLPVLDDRVLLRELNHRINNELASAINLVSAGAVIAEHQEVKAALTGVAELLHRYADVHRALMVPVSDVLIDAAEYLRRLGFAMSRSTLDRLGIQLIFAADALPLESDRCWQLGLMVHELVNGAAQHQFLKPREGEIRVELTRSGASVKCTVSDNGSITASRQPGQSLAIVSYLAGNLGGRIEPSVETGAGPVLIAFPLTEREQRATGAAAWRRTRATRRTKTRNAVTASPAAGGLSTPSEAASRQSIRVDGESGASRGVGAL